jgi:glutathione S-transferase
MQIYGSTFSPYVRKTLAYANEKGISLDLVQAMPNSNDPEFRAVSPFGKIPGFRDGDFTISDSTAIIAYLEAKYPEPPLIPIAPESRARTVWYEEFADTIVIACMGKVFFNRVVAPRFLGRPGDEGAAATAVSEELPPLIDYLETVASASGFLVDDRITVADIAVASPFINLGHCDIVIDAKTHPKAAAYIAGIVARPSFAGFVTQEKAFLAR